MSQGYTEKSKKRNNFAKQLQDEHVQKKLTLSRQMFKTI